MKDFDRYYDYIKDEDARNEVRKIADKVSYVSRSYVSAATDFVNPYVAEMSLPIINNYDLKFELFPSYEFCERKILILYPDFYESPDLSEYVAGLRILNRSKFKILNHRDYLGALMSLGIDRDKTGDIYVYEDHADLLIHADMADYVLYNLESIGKNKIETTRVEVDALGYKEQEYVLMNITPSSLRLDSVIKHITNKSRETAADMIRAGLIKVNWQAIDKGTYVVKDGDMISIRKYGRYKVSGLPGVTKSGRVKVEIKHYV